jgi:hypothetical protein
MEAMKMKLRAAITMMSLALAAQSVRANQDASRFLSDSLGPVQGSQIARPQVAIFSSRPQLPAGVSNALQPTGGDLPTGGVRPRDVLSEYLVEQGRTRSATFHRLLGALTLADVVIYIDVEPVAAQAPSGQLQFITTEGGLRYVQITVRPETTSWHRILSRHVELVAILGHELQHALEIASAPEVTDSSTFAELYGRIGLQLQDHAFDTVAARLVGTRIRTELMEGDGVGEIDGM